MAVQLIRPHARFEASYARYIAELGNEERYPFPLDFTYASFADLLAEARARGMEEVYVHCHKHNDASARTIRSNGGVLHSEVALPSEHDVVQRYLITLSR